MFLKVVHKGPSKLKIATVFNAGELAGTDIAVQAHSVLEANSQGVIIDQSEAMLLEGSPDEVPLVFSPGVLPLVTHMKMRPAMSCTTCLVTEQLSL
jgi:hypothetical protein